MAVGGGGGLSGGRVREAGSVQWVGVSGGQVGVLLGGGWFVGGLCCWLVFTHVARVGIQLLNQFLS